MSDATPQGVDRDAAPGNVDAATVRGFGEEWRTYDQSGVPEAELCAQFERYFRVFPWQMLATDAAGADIGCGS